MDAGTRFTLGWYAANPRGGCDVGIERRIKTAEASRVESRETIRTLPDEECGRIWSQEWNQREAARLVAEGQSQTR